MKYIACFWQNDGGWHSGGYDYTPMYIFDARNDEEAEALATDFALFKKSKMRSGDFSLSYLFKAELELLSINKDNTYNYLQNASAKLIAKFEKDTNFIKLGDYASNLGKKNKKGKKLE